MSNVYLKGESIFLYVKFLNEKDEPAENVIDPKVTIRHEFNGDVYEDLEWTKLNNIDSNEYYYNFTIPMDFEQGLYDVIYAGIVNDKLSTVVDNFHIINKSQIYDDTVKVYGYINDNLHLTSLGDVGIEVESMTNFDKTKSYSKFDGYWETFLYPGSYKASFFKAGFEKMEIQFDIGDENTEVQFNNITLISKQKITNGTGICEVSDSFLLKNGIPLDSLTINAYNINDPQTSIATTTTNNKGFWNVFLDPGFYFLRVTGNSMESDFNKTFRLKISDDCKYELSDLESNKARIRDNIGIGNGNIEYIDYVTDRDGNGICDVQVNVLKGSKIIAQCYTDSIGKYRFMLNEEEYVVDIYHPSFKEIAEFKINLKK